MNNATLTDNLLGQQLDEYRLEALLGRGGMARVYRGFDVNLKRWAAIKVIDAPFRADSDYIRRLEREARAIAQLQHPHIVRLYRYGQANRLFYIAMEFIDGADLGAALATYQEKQQPIPPEKAGRMMRQICLALDYAHGKGVIHRDIKPSNIMLDEQGDAFLTDFGLVLLDDQRTQGEIFGTPHYIAPEQAILSAGAVPQSDLYAVGVILYEMFAGKLPFEAQHPYDLAMLHLTEPPPPPRSLNPDISPELEAVILKTLAKEPEDRYPTGAALVDALDQALQLISGKTPSPPRPVSPRSRTESSIRVQAEARTLRIGNKLGRYILTEQISGGGIVQVYRGRHEMTKRNVLIKILFAHAADDEELLKRFHREAQAIAALRHLHIVQMHDFGVVEGLYCIVIEYITGGTLEDWLVRLKSSGNSVPLIGVKQIVRGVAAGLDYAHTRGVVHLNLRPANIMLTATGQIVLADLGLAQLLRAVDYTMVGTKWRMPTYMSPEQARGERGDARSDIYALGVILYELLTGRAPFEADTPLAILRKHMDEPVPPPRSLKPRLPAAVEPVVLKALAKEPATRYQTAGELAEAVAQALSGNGF